MRNDLSNKFMESPVLGNWHVGLVNVFQPTKMDRNLARELA